MARRQGTIAPTTGHHDKDEVSYTLAELLTADITELTGSLTGNNTITDLRGPNLTVTTDGVLSAEHDHTSDTIRPSLLNMTPQDSTPAGPTEDDIYLDDGTNTSDSNRHFRQYDGSSWVDI